MKLRCPRCERKLNVPDKYAGKAIRCPACNRAFNVPAPKAAVGGSASHSELDLGELAGLESQSSQMGQEELDQHEQGVAQQQTDADAAETGLRLCPSCGKKTKVKDPYVEVLCSHCWSAIPALVRGGGLGGAAIARPKAVSITGAGGFYAELASSMAYPLPAITSILTATGIAVLAALLPVVVMTGLSNLMEQSNVGTVEGVKEADLSSVQLILIGIFGLEIFFFSAVAIHAFFDVVRTTAIGTDKPPNLSFAPGNWGKSFASYLVLVFYLGALTFIVSFLALNVAVDEIIKGGNVQQVLTTAGTTFYVGMILISSLVPMNLLGLSLGNIGQALNPVRVFKSVAGTHVHYIFLVLILVVYGGMFGYGFLALIFDWFIPKVGAMVSSSSKGGIGQVALSLLAWGVVMLFFFYGTYVLARLHGLFARSFRKKLQFGTA